MVIPSLTLILSFPPLSCSMRAAAPPGTAPVCSTSRWPSHQARAHSPGFWIASRHQSWKGTLLEGSWNRGRRHLSEKGNYNKLAVGVCLCCPRFRFQSIYPPSGSIVMLICKAHESWHKTTTTTLRIHLWRHVDRPCGPTAGWSLLDLRSPQPVKPAESDPPDVRRPVRFTNPQEQRTLSPSKPHLWRLALWQDPDSLD